MSQMGNKRNAALSDDELIARYRECLSVRLIERETGISGSTIYRLLEKRGIERVGLAHYRQNATSYGPDGDSEIRRRYEAGEYYAQLVEAFGGTFYSIKAAIKRAGGKLVPVTPPMTEDEKAEVRRLRDDGVSQQAISLKIRRSQSMVSRFLRAEGEVFKRRRGDKHGMWKGGRYKDGSGYIRALVGRDDPMAVMAMHDGYVPEHRLVMARKLGRPLRKTETVHHIDGDRTNNDLGNLQLRQGGHGKHSVTICLDCGSHNLGHAPL